MADKTKIEWTEATWNPVTGCSVVSPGCTNCYAMKLAGTRLQHHPSRSGLTAPSKGGPVWTGEVRFNAQWLDQPLRWGRPRDIFVCAHGDLFHEDVPDIWIDKTFAVMALASRHRFQVLTKRPGRMRAAINRLGRSIETLEHHARGLGYTLKYEGHCLVQWPLPNVWLGTSAERQQEADTRIPDLIETLAAVRFVSLEPLLGPIELTKLRCDIGIGDRHHADMVLNGLTGKSAAAWRGRETPTEHGIKLSGKLDWVIVGGESGPHARPMHPDWARSLRDQCAAADVPFFYKQWGEWAPGETVPIAIGARDCPP